ncbi:hypothetical protein HZC32_02375 [Candidatus Woesearchaeota archaeon]|nr:hypothetical protein [Candidatus Woesearchaeota archaeon]
MAELELLQNEIDNHGLVEVGKLAKTEKLAKKCKKLLNGRVNRLTRRMEKLLSQMGDLGGKLDKLNVTKLDALRNDILAKHKEIDNNLEKILSKKDATAIGAAVAAEKEVYKLITGLITYEKALEGEAK